MTWRVAVLCLLVLSGLGGIMETMDAQSLLRLQVRSATGSGSDEAPATDPIVLEDFDVARTCCGVSENIWNFQDGGTDGTQSISGGVLTMPITAATTSIQWYYKCQDNFTWLFLRDCLDTDSGGDLAAGFGTSGQWTNGTYNQLTFYVKAPTGVGSAGYSENFQWGTFHHNYGANGGTTSDDNGWHFYHKGNIPNDGLYWMFIIDTFPDHIRGGGGSDEYGNKEYLDPTGAFSANNVGKNYFDLMTAFYLDWVYTTTGSGSAYMREQVSMRTVTYDDDLYVQVRNPHAAYKSSTNTVYAWFGRRKDQPSHQYQVRYKYTSFSTFTGGTLLSTITSGPDGAYNMVPIEFTDAELANHTWLWIAVKPSDNADFRQFTVPIGSMRTWGN